MELTPLPGAVRVPLSLIDAGRYQPRKRFDDAALAELADNVRQHGVMQNVLLRPVADGRFEIVAGERRCRASALAGLEDVPALVKDLTLMQVLEMQAIENGQRENLDPLEEAYSYELLLTPPEGQTGYTVAQIAKTVSKSPTHIRRMLTLCRLIPQAQEYLLAKLISTRTALDIARMPPGVQADAWKRITGTQAAPDKAIAPKVAAEILQQHFMLRLSTATFPIKDATLLPEAGGCPSCPKRTGASPDLFADVEEADTCTDPVCHSAKVVAHNQRRKDQARQDGLQVLEGDNARALLKFGPDSQQLGGDYVYMDEPLEELTGNTKSLAKLLGTLLTPSALFEHPRDLTLREIVTTSKAHDALRDHGLLQVKPAKGTPALSLVQPKKRADSDEAPTEPKKATGPTKAEEKAAKAKRAEEELAHKIERTWRRDLFEHFHASLHDASDYPPAEAMRLVAMDMALTFLDDHEALDGIAPLWGWPEKDDEQGLREYLDPLLQEMDGLQLALLLAELVVIPDAYPTERDLGRDPTELDLVQLTRLPEMEIDVDQIMAEADQLHRPKAKTPKAPKRKTPIYPTESPPPASDTQGAPSQRADTSAQGEEGQAPQGAQTMDEKSDLPHWVGQMVQVKGAKGTWQIHALREHGEIAVRELGNGQREQVVVSGQIKVLPGQVRPGPGQSAPPPAVTGRLTVRYRNPATGETWSGRGLQPKWVQAALAAGQTLADFDTTADQ